MQAQTLLADPLIRRRNPSGEEPTPNSDMIDDESPCSQVSKTLKALARGHSEVPGQCAKGIAWSSRKVEAEAVRTRGPRFWPQHA